MDNITIQKESIDVRTKLVSNKISIPLRNPNRNIKPGLKMSLEGPIKKNYDDKRNYEGRWNIRESCGKKTPQKDNSKQFWHNSKKWRC